MRQAMTSRREPSRLGSAGREGGRSLGPAAEAILRAAEEVFAERGFAGATTREIAARARVNKGLIFYYFRDKRNLFATVIDNLFAYFRSRIRQFLREGGDELSLLRQAVEFAVDFTAEHVSLLFIVQREIVDRGRFHRLLLRRHFIPIIKMGIDFFERASQKGKIRPIDPVRFIYFLLGANVFYFTAAPVLEGLLGRGAPFTAKGLAEQKRELWELIRRGIEPQPEGATAISSPNT